MIDASLILKSRQRDAADFYNGRNAVGKADNAFYHGVDASAQLFEFPVSADSDLGVKISVGDGS